MCGGGKTDGCLRARMSGHSVRMPPSGAVANSSVRSLYDPRDPAGRRMLDLTDRRMLLSRQLEEVEERAQRAQGTPQEAELNATARVLRESMLDVGARAIEQASERGWRLGFGYMMEHRPDVAARQYTSALSALAEAVGAQPLAQYGQSTADLDTVVQGIEAMEIEPEGWQEQYREADTNASASAAAAASSSSASALASSSASAPETEPKHQRRTEGLALSLPVVRYNDPDHIRDKYLALLINVRKRYTKHVRRGEKKQAEDLKRYFQLVQSVGRELLKEHPGHALSLESIAIDGLTDLSPVPETPETSAASESTQNATGPMNTFEFPPNQSVEEYARDSTALRDLARAAEARARETTSLTPVRGRGSREFLAYHRRPDNVRPRGDVDENKSLVWEERMDQGDAEPQRFVVTQEFIDRLNEQFRGIHRARERLRSLLQGSEQRAREIRNAILEATDPRERSERIARVIASAEAMERTAAGYREQASQCDGLLSDVLQPESIAVIQREAESKRDEETLRENERRSIAVGMARGNSERFRELASMAEADAAAIRRGLREVENPFAAEFVTPPRQSSANSGYQGPFTFDMPGQRNHTEILAEALRQLDAQRNEYNHLVARGSEQEECDDCILGFETLREELAESMPSAELRRLIENVHIDSDGTLEREVHQRLGV